MKSLVERIFCWHCCEHTKQKYIGKSKKSWNTILPFPKRKIYECIQCGKLNED